MDWGNKPLGDAPTRPSGDMIKLDDYRGRLLLVYPKSIETILTQYSQPGEQNNAVRADVVVLDGPGAPVVFEDTALFGKVLVQDLSMVLNQPVWGRINKESKPGAPNSWWKLQPGSAEDRAKVVAYRDGSLITAPVSDDKPPF